MMHPLILAASLARLLNMLTPTGLRQILLHHGWQGGQLDSDDEDGGFGLFRSRKRRLESTDQPPKVPSDAGMQLMGSGDFGSNANYVDELKKRKKALAAKLMWRELGLDALGGQRATRSISQVSIMRIPGIF